MLRVGTRGSKLALAQTATVTDALLRLDPNLELETRAIATDSTQLLDKSRYVSSIEASLREGQIDLAVHSAKDVPGAQTPGLLIVAVPERAPRHDVLLGAEALEALPEGAVVGTSSLRRRAQLLTARSDLRVKELHGNIDSRIAALEAGEFDAIVLAAAGLQRLGVGAELAQAELDFVTAPGQGCLALQVREVDIETSTLIAPLTHAAAQRELIAERAAASGLLASCNTPLGICAQVEAGAAENGKDKISLRGWLGLPDGTRSIEQSLSGLASEAHLLGHLLAQRMRGAGADELLKLAEELAA